MKNLKRIISADGSVCYFRPNKVVYLNYKESTKILSLCFGHYAIEFSSSLEEAENLAKLIGWK